VHSRPGRHSFRPPEGVPRRAQARREAILGALKAGGPTQPPKLASLLREKGDATVDGQIVADILEHLARTGEVVKQESGAWIYRRKAVD
jgi:hypothetical protein